MGLGTFTVSVEDGRHACIGSGYDYQTYYWHKQPLVLKLSSLEYRREKGDKNEICKIMHGFYDPETASSLFKLNKSVGTRGHPLKLCKKTDHISQYAHVCTRRVLII